MVLSVCISEQIQLRVWVVCSGTAAAMLIVLTLFRVIERFDKDNQSFENSWAFLFDGHQHQLDLPLTVRYPKITIIERYGNGM